MEEKGNMAAGIVRLIIFLRLTGRGKSMKKKKAVFNKKWPISIKHIVDYRCLGLYVETDILQKTVTIGKGRKRIHLDIIQVKKLKKLLEKQISRIDSVYCDN